MLTLGSLCGWSGHCGANRGESGSGCTRCGNRAHWPRLRHRHWIACRCRSLRLRRLRLSWVEHGCLRRILCASCGLHCSWRSRPRWLTASRWLCLRHSCCFWSRKPWRHHMADRSRSSRIYLWRPGWSLWLLPRGCDGLGSHLCLMSWLNAVLFICLLWRHCWLFGDLAHSWSLTL